jgi:hypothetical protein
MKQTFIALISVFACLFGNNLVAQTWPCAQYLTRQVSNGGGGYRTNISYVYTLGVSTPPITVTVAKLDTLLNASAMYNGYIWAWKQYTGTAQSGAGGQRLVKLNYNNWDSTVTPVITGYTFSSVTMNCNAAFVDSNGVYYVISTATSGASSFVLSRIDLTTTPSPTLLSNLTVNLPSGSTVSSGGLGDLVYTKDSVFAWINTVGLFRFPLPPTSTTSVTANLTTTANRTVGSLFYVNSDLHNVYGYGSVSGSTTQDRLLKISTQTGTITELTTSGIAVSQSDGAGCPTGDFSNPLSFSISGTIYDDTNGLSDNTVNGTGTNAGSLYAVLYDAVADTVVAKVAVAAGGTYSFSGLNAGNYSVEITTNSATVGAVPPAVALPAGYIKTGEFLGSGSGSDGTVNGILPIGSVSSSVTNANFGIEQPPTANAVTASSQVNPGGSIKVIVPTLNGSDPEQGTLPGTGNLDTLIINTLPNTSTMGKLYYNGVAVVAGDTIKNYNPTLLKLDPLDGAVTASFTYSEVDAALKSSSAATVSMSFTTISISGNVYDDANGLSDGTVNGIGTNAGGLNAVLYDAVADTVVAKVAVAVGGTYSFSGLNAGNYSVEITTNSATVGAVPPAVAIPAGYIKTGEFLGSGSGSDGTVNGILSVGSVSSNVTNANFGIEQTPSANSVTAIGQINPGGTNTVDVPALNGTDTEDGAIGTGGRFTISTLPIDGTLYYNGSTVTAGQTIIGYDPTKLKVDPNDGLVTVIFTYTVTDAAGVTSASATVTIPFVSLLPVSLTSFSAAVNGKKVELNWSINSEINTQYYEVEKSSNGTDFTSIGKLSAKGNSNVLADYHTSDILPVPGLNYYRLKIVDENGLFNYSKTIIVKVDGISTIIASVRPNPFVNTVDIFLNLKNASKIRISISDNSGKILYRDITKGISGSNRINVNSLSKLSTGTYIMNIVTDEGSIHQKIVKQP